MAGKLAIEPSSMKPAPVRNVPTMIEARRPTVSATTPVGTSSRNVVVSSAVPTSTSCSASRSAATTRYTAAIVAMR
jgi:hypothetical protein